jgi:hypothetical protein
MAGKREGVFLNADWLIGFATSKRAAQINVGYVILFGMDEGGRCCVSLPAISGWR